MSTLIDPCRGNHDGDHDGAPGPDDGVLPDFRTRCPHAPDEAPHGWHEPMANEMRCVYCGTRLAPVNCNGCGRFMSCDEIKEHESRCAECA